MAMNVGEAREGEPVSEINTTPLIDVMLVLLIMLIVALPAQRHAVQLDTPIPCKVDCPEPLAPPDPIRVAVDYTGAISWNGAPVSRVELQQRFAAESRRTVQAELHIQADPDAEYGVLAHVMAAAQREGIKKMGIVGGG